MIPKRMTAPWRIIKTVQKSNKLSSGDLERIQDSPNTLGESTYYYAVQLSESGTVLRLSRNLQNMLGTFLQVLPFEVFFSLLLFLLSLFCAQTATRRIVIPLTKAADHLEQLPLGEEYEELTPFLKKIQNQKRYNTAAVGRHPRRERKGYCYSFQYTRRLSALRSVWTDPFSE